LSKTPSPWDTAGVADALLRVLVANPLIVFELLWVYLEIVDDNERVAEETGVSNDEAGNMGGEVQRVVDNDEKGASVVSGELKVDFGAAVSEVDTE
jgi:hypothetical protein